jgi:hypothetical protein
MKLRIVFPAILLVILIVMLILALGYKRNAGTMPLLIGIPITCLVAWQLVKEIRDREGKEASREGEEKEGSMAKLLESVGWIAALGLLLFLLGFYIVCPLFTFVYLTVRRQKWAITGICTLSVFVLVYVLFKLILNTELYPGILFGG